MGRMVTREFSYQKLTILVYNKVTKSNEEMEITIPDAEYTSRRLENTINKAIDTNVYKMIDVLNTESFNYKLIHKRKKNNHKTNSLQAGMGEVGNGD